MERLRVTMRLARVLAVAAAATFVFFAGSARAEISVIVDKSAQRMTVKRDGVLLYNWPVSTGRRGYGTPSGAFTAFRMEADHFSKEWDDAPMPYSIFFTKIGHAIHGTNDAQHLGRPVSHGCVRLSVENAETLYGLVQEDGVLHTKVTLVGSEEVALARPDTGARRNEAAREQQYDPNYPQPDRRLVDPRAQYPQPNYRPRYDADRDYSPPQYVQPQYAPPPSRQPLYGYPSYPPGYGGRYD
jgi:L,D-transpeptidase catalytic domain